MKSEKTTSNGSTPEADRPAYWPYLNEFHKQHSEASMAATSRRPLRSVKEAYEQYDRLKAGKNGAHPSTLLKKET